MKYTDENMLGKPERVIKNEEHYQHSSNFQITDGEPRQAPWSLCGLASDPESLFLRGERHGLKWVTYSFYELDNSLYL